MKVKTAIIAAGLVLVAGVGAAGADMAAVRAGKKAGGGMPEVEKSWQAKATAWDLDFVQKMYNNAKRSSAGIKGECYRYGGAVKYHRN